MAISNHERVGKALNLLNDRTRPFVEPDPKARYRQLRFEQARFSLTGQQSSFAGMEGDSHGAVSAGVVVVQSKLKF